MKKKFKQLLLTSAVGFIGLTGFTNAGVAQAGTKDGFYLTPNAEVIFIDKKFTKGNGTGVGGGVGLNLGYQIKNFQIELAVGYDYYGGKGTVGQTTSAFGTGWVAAAKAFQIALATGANAQAAGAAAGAEFNGAITGINNGIIKTVGVSTTTESSERFIPVTLGLNYVTPFAGGKFSFTPGIAAGVWFHSINRKISTSIAGAAAIETTDKANETKGVVVPSLSFDYTPIEKLTISLGGKFYIVPGGYSDAYSNNAKAAANASVSDITTFDANVLASGNLPLGLTPAYANYKQSFWYGGLNLGVRYTF